MAIEINTSRDPATGKRKRDVRGDLVIWRWIQFGAGAWTDTLSAVNGQVVIDLNAMDAATDSSATGPIHYGPPDPGMQLILGSETEQEPQWYGREYRIEFKVPGQISGTWAATVDGLKAFVETVFSGDLIFEANRNIERPPMSNLATPAKWIEWELEFPR